MFHRAKIMEFGLPTTLFVIIMAMNLSPSDGYPSAETNLMQKLFSVYNRDVSPAHNCTSPVKLNFHAAVKQVIDFDEKNQVITWNIWVRQAWNDGRLKWNESQFHMDRIVVNPLSLWLPDIYLYNNAQERYHGFDNDMQDGAAVTSDGMVLWWTQVLLKSTCKFSVRYFPFDEQRCELQFGSWTQSGHQLDIAIYSESGDLSKTTKNGEWLLVDLKAVKNIVYYNCCPEPYPLITYTLMARRRCNFYLVNFMLPCTLVALISVLAFCLPYRSGERVTLLITSLLSLTFFSLMISDMIPPTSDGTPLFSQFMIAILIEISIAVTLICVIMKIESNVNPPSGFVRRFLNRYLAFLVGLRSRNHFFSDRNMNSVELSYAEGRGCYKRKDSGAIINGGQQAASSKSEPEDFSQIAARPLETPSPREVGETLQSEIDSHLNPFKESLLSALQRAATYDMEKLEANENFKERRMLAKKMDNLLHGLFAIVVLITIVVPLLSPPKISL